MLMRQPEAYATADARAPVIGAREIVISADPETVWEVLAGIDRWPAWNPDVKWVSVEGDVVEGTQFRWKSGSGTLTSTLRRVEPPRLIAWTGRIFGSMPSTSGGSSLTMEGRSFGRRNLSAVS
jgi:uncharacterized protein YndB with AHSA1/START domain